jgi:hypothetical protein
MLHIPLLRAGKPYKSLVVAKIPHFQTGETVVEISQANRGLIARDLLQMRLNRHILSDLPVAQLLKICKQAADHFEKSDLPLGESSQSPDDYIQQLSATTGMPESLCRKNMAKITLVLHEIRAVLGGLTRGLDLAMLDSGWSRSNGTPLSFACQTDALGAILPSNSPGVHALWLPSIPLKVPLILRPGSQEPWTPYRICQAFLAAGLPPEALSYYPSDHSGATEILLRTGRSMLFGDKKTVQPWQHDPGVQIHGPGWSKIIIGEDKIEQWQDYLDLMVTSAVANGGRSCLNISGVWVPKYGREIAGAFAARMAEITARAMDDPEAQIAAFANKKLAEMLSDSIDAQVAEGTAIDLTEKHRSCKRLVEAFGTTFLLPTVIRCERPDHPLAHAEYLFPFVAVVEVPQEELLAKMGSTLVATAITEDRDFIRDLFAAPNVDRLNIGPIPTVQISWDQPHEGNLFEHLYRQRSLQIAGDFVMGQTLRC